ncbi:MAG: PAS domain S-box protein, partial [Acidobacteriota bacterium]|nr:PAS domain S-box protein [Acidobacteriota bacterium]
MASPASISAFLAAAMDEIRADMGKVQVVDPAASVLRIVAHRGFDDAFLNACQNLPVNKESDWAKTLLEGRRLVIEDVEADERAGSFRAVLQAAGSRAVQSTPLIGGSGKLVGILSTHFRSVHRPGEEELSRIDLYATLLAASIEASGADKRGSEEYLPDVPDNAPFVLWEADAQGSVVSDSAGWRSFTGRTLQQCIGWNWLDAIHQEDRVRAARMWQFAVGSRRSAGIKLRLRSHTGDYRPISFTAAPLENPDGSTRGWIALGAEIGGREPVEGSAQASEQRLRRLLDTDAVGIIFFDSAGTVVDANEVFLRMTGYTREDVASGHLTWRHLTPPEYIETSEARMGRFAQTGLIGPYEQEYILKDGSRRWMLFTGRELGDGVIAEYCIDITKRIRTAEMLEKRESQLNAALAAINEAICIADLKGRPIEINEAFAVFCRFQSKEECARTITENPGLIDVFLPDGSRLEPDQWPLFRGIHGESGVDAEYILRRNDTGESWHATCNFAPIRNAAGEIVGGVVAARDVTDRKNAEDALRESERRLRMALAAAEA